MQPNLSKDVRPGPSAPLLITALALVLGALACLVALSGAATYLADDHPVLAAQIWPFDDQAAAALAQTEFDHEAPTGNLSYAESDARKALALAPLNEAAFRVLGLIAARRDDFAAADRYMAAARRRSLRDSDTSVWTYYRGLDQKDYTKSFAAADTILRRRNDLATLLYPTMAQAIDHDPAARRAAVARLELLPGWRPSFIKAVIREADEAQEPYALLADLRRGGAAPTDEEVGAYVNRLVRAHLFTAAYVAWTENLPPARQPTGSLLYNGDFRWENGLPPFDWEINHSGLASAQIAAAPGHDGPALYVNYAGGLTSQRVADQLIVLPTGRYQLSGMTLFNERTQPERLHWLINCEGGDLMSELVNKTPSNQWRPFSVTFDVPPDDCAAQRVILEASPGSSLEPFTAWYANLRVTRVGPIPPEDLEKLTHPLGVDISKTKKSSPATPGASLPNESLGSPLS